MFSVDNVNKYTGEVITIENLTRKEAVRIKTSVEHALTGSNAGPVPELREVTISIMPGTFIKFSYGIQGAWVVDRPLKGGLYSVYPYGFKTLQVDVRLKITDEDEGLVFREISQSHAALM